MSVFIGSIPNNQQDDITLAKDILKGSVANKGWVEILEKELEDMFNSKPFLFNRGRDSLFFFLKLLNLKSTDEVMLQAFTCIAVVSPIIWANAKPIYIDIEKGSFNININLLKKKITENTRVIIIQHTFGNVADMKKIREIVDKVNSERETNRKIYLIEDCAHLFKRDLSKLNIGKYSDMYFFSFSQDKSISCTQGALMIINDNKLLKKAVLNYQNISYPKRKDALYNARYIIIWNKIKKNYFKTLIPFTNITVGRILLIIYRSLGLVKKQADNNTILSPKVEKLSNIQACLLLNQLKKTDMYNNHRAIVVEIYNNLLEKEYRYSTNSKHLLRYPILIQNVLEVKRKLLDLNVISGNWYKYPIYPLKHDSKILNKIKYRVGSCPNAEFLGKQTLNLPTNIEVSPMLAEKISSTINNFAKPINI